MFNLSAIDAGIAIGGYGVGLVVGCLDNFRKTGSLNGRPFDAPRKVSFVVQHLEVDRDKGGAREIKSCYDMIKPFVWNPLMPLEHLLPLTLIIITEVFIAAISPGATVAATALLLTSYTFEIIVVPVVLNFAVVATGSILRVKTKSYFDQKGVDPSGHALAQSGSAVYKLFVISSLARLNLLYTPYRVVAAVTTLSDYLWTYRTGSSYHSVLDMTITTLFMGIGFGAVFVGHRALVAYAPKVTRLILARLPAL